MYSLNSKKIYFLKVGQIEKKFKHIKANLRNIISNIKIIEHFMYIYILYRILKIHDNLARQFKNFSKATK